MASVALEDSAFAATGWVAADESRRYWRHPLRYPDATFDVHEVRAIENNRRPASRPQRARACLCAIPLVLNAPGSCAKCGRRVR